MKVEKTRLEVPPERDEKTGEAFVERLLAKMSLAERIGQLHQAPYYSDIVTGPAFDAQDTVQDIKAGKVGSVLNVTEPGVIRSLQETARHESPSGIPLLICLDIIHGFRTIFPVNLALAASFDPDLVREVSRAAAWEASRAGLHLTFSPMCDIARDPRWGRVMETSGEDPYLASVMTKAYIEGYQGEGLAAADTLATCAKHFAGYGAIEAGREYNTVDISERTLHRVHLPPFRAAVESGVPMVMTAFNTLFDIPCTANEKLLRDILREKLGFKGVTISDYTSSEEIINHKIAKDHEEVAKKCFQAGLEHEMVSKTYNDHLASLVEAGEIKEEEIDKAARRILLLKWRLGLFHDPYRNMADSSAESLFLPKTQALARKAARESMVLLENDGVLPLDDEGKIVFTGSYVASQDLLGAWSCLGREEEAVSIAEALEKEGRDHLVIPAEDPLPEEDLARLEESEVIVVAVGEGSSQSGEGKSRSQIRLSDEDAALLDRLAPLPQKKVAVIFAGRPLVLTGIKDKVDALLYVFHPGSMGGPAVTDILFGRHSPAGRLTMSFPRNEGQIPIYHGQLPTGRPHGKKRAGYRFSSRYTDIENEPLYPFGHGLTYGNIRYGDVRLDKERLSKDDILTVSVTMENESDRQIEEVVQCYVEALSFSVSRPVNELCGFRKVTFSAGEKKEVAFTLGIEAFRSHDKDLVETAEKTDYLVKVGPDAKTTKTARVHVEDE